MRRTWSWATLLSLLVALAGCYSVDRHKVKPPKHEEQYILPPQDQAKWDQPLEYPKGTLNQDMIKKKAEQDKDIKPGMNGAGGGPRMGMGGGGGY